MTKEIYTIVERILAEHIHQLNKKIKGLNLDYNFLMGLKLDLKVKGAASVFASMSTDDEFNKFVSKLELSDADKQSYRKAWRSYNVYDFLVNVLANAETPYGVGALMIGSLLPKAFLSEREIRSDFANAGSKISKQIIELSSELSGIQIVQGLLSRMQKQATEIIEKNATGLMSSWLDTVRKLQQAMDKLDDSLKPPLENLLDSEIKAMATFALSKREFSMCSDTHQMLVKLEKLQSVTYILHSDHQSSYRGGRDRFFHQPNDEIDEAPQSDLNKRPD
jgi:hypothetical protein